MHSEGNRSLQTHVDTGAGALTSLVQPDGLGQAGNKQAVHNESWCVLHGDGWDADFSIDRLATDGTAGLTLQDTGVFPSTLLKFRRESKVSLLVAEVAIT